MAKEKEGRLPKREAKGSRKSPTSFAGKVITDDRFAAAHHDPRFQRFPKSERKVEIDQRFAGMFKDKAFQVKSAVDKRGRKVNKQKQKEDMRKYYRLQNEEEDWGSIRAAVVGAEPHGGSTETQAGHKGSTNKASTKAGSQRNAAAGKEQPGQEGVDNLNAKTQKMLRKAKTHALKVARMPVRSKPIGEPIGRKTDTSGKFTTSDDEKESGPGDDSSGDKDGETDESSDERDEEEPRAAERWARVRGLTGPQASSNSDSEQVSEGGSSDLDEEPEVEDLDLAEWGIGAMAGNPDEQVPEVQEETSRLAVLDLEWAKIRAVDIFAMLKSFLGKGQALERVNVYPSDYGLKMMAEEAKFGPVGLLRHPEALTQPDALKPSGTDNQVAENGAGGRAYRVGKQQRAAILEALNEEESGDESDDGTDKSDDSDSDESKDDDTERRRSGRAAQSSGSEDDDVRRRRLQLSERSRLRYFYAIVDCKDVATAAHLYKECDGMEFEHSANTFDLRYVPASEDFSAREARDTAVEVPLGYTAPDVGIAAMLHTNPKLTWDADSDDRKRLLSKRPTKEQLRDDDFKAYLGSESEEEEQEEEADAERYRKLLLTGDGDPFKGVGKEWGGKGNDQDEGSSDAGNDERQQEQDRSMELEVTFGGGLDALGQRLKAKQEEAVNRRNDTVWQAYLRRRKDKKMEAKRLGRQDDSDDDAGSDEDGAEEDPFFQHDDSAFDDPFFKDADEGDAAGLPVDDSARPGAADKQKAARKAERQAQKAKAEAERQQRAELELLLMDDSTLEDISKLGGGARAKGQQQQQQAANEPKGKLSRKARLAAKKAERLAKRGAASDDEDAAPVTAGPGFKVDVTDERFAHLFTSPDFALDPTDPRFVASEGAQAILQEASKRRSNKVKNGTAKLANYVPKIHTGEVDSGANLQALAASLKRKAESGYGKSGKPAKKKRN